MESLHREIQQGLNVVEKLEQRGRSGGSDARAAFVAVSLVYVNALMIQQVLSEPEWQARLTAVDLRALSLLKWQHVNPYGTFTLNMQDRLPLEQVEGTLTSQIAPHRVARNLEHPRDLPDALPLTTQDPDPHSSLRH